jgi:hypothetical protein
MLTLDSEYKEWQIKIIVYSLLLEPTTIIASTPVIERSLFGKLDA